MTPKQRNIIEKQFYNYPADAALYEEKRREIIGNTYENIDILA